MNKIPIKIIFLDVDGVLNNTNSKQEFNNTCFENLKKIIDETHAIIIISSTYKLEEQSMNRLWIELNKYGINKTNNYINKYKSTKDLMDYNLSRGDEILDTIKLIMNDNNYTIVSWIVIDDGDLLNGLNNFNKSLLENNFIKINNKFGLTYNDISKIINILNFKSVNNT